MKGNMNICVCSHANTPTYHTPNNSNKQVAGAGENGMVDNFLRHYPIYLLSQVYTYLSAFLPSPTCNTLGPLRALKLMVLWTSEVMKEITLQSWAC